MPCARRSVAVRDELGDLLFQVVFQSRIAEERGLFDFDARGADAIGDKLERRHPHVFGVATIGDVTASRRRPGKRTRRPSVARRGRATARSTASRWACPR